MWSSMCYDLNLGKTSVPCYEVTAQSRVSFTSLLKPLGEGSLMKGSKILYIPAKTPLSEELQQDRQVNINSPRLPFYSLIQVIISRCGWIAADHGAKESRQVSRNAAGSEN